MKGRVGALTMMLCVHVKEVHYFFVQKTLFYLKFQCVCAMIEGLAVMKKVLMTILKLLERFLFFRMLARVL